MRFVGGLVAGLVLGAMAACGTVQAVAVDGGVDAGDAEATRDVHVRATCTFDGATYREGDRMPNDECSGCTCNAYGLRVCAANSCECETDGGVYAFDEPMPSANPCEKCRCAASPFASCTPIPGCIADAGAE
jgi:hypothetical protein